MHRNASRFARCSPQRESTKPAAQRQKNQRKAPPQATETASSKAAVEHRRDKEVALRARCGPTRVASCGIAGNDCPKGRRGNSPQREETTQRHFSCNTATLSTKPHRERGTRSREASGTSAIPPRPARKPSARHSDPASRSHSALEAKKYRLPTTNAHPNAATNATKANTPASTTPPPRSQETPYLSHRHRATRAPSPTLPHFQETPSKHRVGHARRIFTMMHFGNRAYEHYCRRANATFAPRRRSPMQCFPRSPQQANRSHSAPW